MAVRKLLLRLRAERDCAWERRYHRKVRGRFAQALDGAGYDHLFDSSAAPFTFSEPMPYAPELDAGDELHLVVQSPDVGVLRAISEDLHRDPTITAGSFVLEVRAATPLREDVGPPGNTGTITTGSGIVLGLPDHESTTGAAVELWSDRDHDRATFREALHGRIRDEIDHVPDVPQPTDPVFDEYHHRKTYVVELEVTPKNDLTLIASKWDFGYDVRDGTHREHLNALLGTGLGAKRSYGFGMLQTRGAPEAAASSGVAARG